MTRSGKESSKVSNKGAGEDTILEESRLARLRILGKEVTIGCRPGEEDALKQAAAYIDSSMRDLKSRNATSSLEKIAIVTAINTADALLKARARVADPDAADRAVKKRLAALNASLNDVLATDEIAAGNGASRDNDGGRTDT